MYVFVVHTIPRSEWVWHITKNSKFKVISEDTILVSGAIIGVAEIESLSQSTMMN